MREAIAGGRGGRGGRADVKAPQSSPMGRRNCGTKRKGEKHKLVLKKTKRVKTEMTAKNIFYRQNTVMNESQ